VGLDSRGGLPGVLVPRGKRQRDGPCASPIELQEHFTHRELIDSSARVGLTGGAIYDALIAATVRHTGATLLTRDQRARTVYERMDVRYEIVD
jgi:hypothetical protein